MDALNVEIKRENQDVEWILVSLWLSAAIGEEEEERRKRVSQEEEEEESRKRGLSHAIVTPSACL